MISGQALDKDRFFMLLVFVIQWRSNCPSSAHESFQVFTAVSSLPDDSLELFLINEHQHKKVLAKHTKGQQILQFLS